ncbi:MAG: RNA polymerase sigma factor [Actinomycetota bacterium]
MLQMSGRRKTAEVTPPAPVTGEPVLAMNEVATEDLVARAQAGETEAFAMIFERFHDEIYRFATRRLHDPQAGQDAAADTFVDAFAGLHRFRWRGVPFEAWLYTIARRRVADRLRAGARSTPALVDVSPDHATVVEDQMHVRSLMAELSPSEREVIELRFMEDLDVEQTARRLGKNAGAIRVAQHRALARLRTMMAEGTT